MPWLEVAWGRAMFFPFYSEHVCVHWATEGALLQGVPPRGMPLKHLEMNFNSRWLSDAGLERLQGLPLQRLGLGYCNNLTSDGLGFLRELPLTNLDLDGSRWLTDSGLAQLQKLPLTKLSLQRCTEVTSYGVRYLKKMQLEYLNVWGCNRIEWESLEPLRETVRRLVT